jgi:DNA polymerase-3 subunit beta
MEIITPHPQLIKTLELISRISTKHVTLPVLQCAVITATEGKIFIKATNLELSIEVLIKGQVIEEGTIAVPMTTFLQSVQYINQPEITLKDEEGVLLLNPSKPKLQLSLSHLKSFQISIIWKVRG